MEISSFETTTFSRRRVEKLNAASRSPLHVVKLLAPIAIIFGVIWMILTTSIAESVSSNVVGPVITPSRLLVGVTILLIVITPLVKGKKAVSEIPPMAPLPTRPTPAVVESHAVERQPEPITVARLAPEYVSNLAPIPSRFDSSMAGARRPSSVQHAPAPFVDDVHSTQRHEFTELLSDWARKLEDLFILPQVIQPLVQALEESDRMLSQYFGRFGFRLRHEAIVPGSPEPFGTISLSDRFLPNPVGTDPLVVAEWNRRQLLESLVNIPGFNSKYRDYVVGRLTTWATRSGLRFSYRHDARPDEEGPTDSHILSHILFTSFDTLLVSGFKDRYVVSASTGSSLMDEFETVFSSVRSSLGMYSNRVAWLEQSSRGPKTPIHFNVGTNQRIYGVAPGGGNLVEALCLFFFLLRRLSPSSAWVQIAHDKRVIIEAAIGGPDSGHVGLSASLFGGKKSSLSALPDLYRGH